MNNQEARPLIELANDPQVIALSKFAAFADTLTTETLQRDYKIEFANAPRRSARAKPYFVGHDGVPGSGRSSNRAEEHLAMALFNAYRELPLATPSGDIRMLDYQLPLQSRRADTAVGKVDLMGVRSTGCTCVIELKVRTQKLATPLRALMQGLAYAANIEANLAAIGAEALGLWGITLAKVPPDVMVMAPTDYWDAFRGKRDADAWQSAMEALRQRVKDGTRVCVEFVELRGFDFQMGLSGEKPRISRVGTCVPAIKPPRERD